MEVAMGVADVVDTVRVDVPDEGRELGAKAQFAPAGRPAQVKFTVPLKPFVMETVIVDVPENPGAATVAGVPPMEKSGVVPKPGHAVSRTLASTDPSPVTRS